MPSSTIVVQYRDGSPARHVKVVLAFPAGVTNDVFTNTYGEVVVEHSSVGRATVYVSGKDCGSFHAPGRHAVTL